MAMTLVDGRFVKCRADGSPVGKARKVVVREACADELDLDSQVEMSLAFGRLRGAIDEVKTASDKLFRAKRCPDSFLLRHSGDLLDLITELDMKLHDANQAARKVLPDNR